MAKVDVRCPFCGQTDPVKKHGYAKSGHQRYRCQSCKRTFQLDYAYRACQPGMSYGHLWCMGIRGRWRILLIDFVQDFNNREMIGVSLEIGNFCTLSTLFNQFGYVSD